MPPHMPLWSGQHLRALDQKVGIKHSSHRQSDTCYMFLKDIVFLIYALGSLVHVWRDPLLSL